MNIPKFSVTHRSIITALLLVTLLWGVSAYNSMSRRSDPEFKIRVCQISVNWPGATAEKVEQLICRPLELELSSLDDVKEITSEARIGFAVLKIELEDNVNDLENAWSKIRARVDRVTPDLPNGALTPDVNTEFGDTSFMVFALYQPAISNKIRYTNRDLKKFSRIIRDNLKALHGIASVDLYGIRKEIIYIETDIGRWSRLDLTAQQLQDIISARNITAPGGMIDTETGRFGLKPSGELTSLQQIRNIAINSDNAPIVIDDIGLEVSRRYEEPESSSCRFAATNQSSPSVIISLTMKKGYNVIALGKEVRKKLDILKNDVLPRDLSFGIMTDSPTEVDKSISDFITNLLEGVAAVILVSILMMSFRASIIMAAAIPLSMIASIGVISLLGVTLDQMSIAALIIALGMLVDNGIVVSDNVVRLMHQGVPRLKAAWLGAQEIAIPVLASTLTTIVAFLPMLTIPGNSGEYMAPLPIVISVTLMCSYIIAMTVTPMMCYVMLRPGKSEEESLIGKALKIFKKKDTKENILNPQKKQFYETVINLALNNKGKVIIIGVAILIASVFLAKSVNKTFFPESDKKTFTADIYLPQGATIEQTKELCQTLENKIRQCSVVSNQNGTVQQQLVNITSFIGGGGPRFYLSKSPETMAPNYALLVINTINGKITPDFANRVRLATQKIPGCRIVVGLLGMGPGSDAPLGIRIYGQSLNGIRVQAEKLKKLYRAFPGVYGTYDLWGELAYQVDVDVNEDAAATAGVNNDAIAQTLSALFSGRYLSTYNEGEDKIPIYLRVPPDQRGNLDVINEIYIEGSKGKVPLDSVATLKTSWAPAKIVRKNLERSCEIRAYTMPGIFPSSIVKKMQPELDKFVAELPARYRIEMAGEQENMNDMNSDVSRAFKIGVVLIILVLIVQFNSFAKPFVILLTIPLSFAGGILGLVIMRQPLDFMAMLGFVSLAGIVVNNAIVLIDFIQSSVKEGNQLREAVINAGKLRMRPILLTSLTTIAGMLPLALFGGPLWKGLSYVMIFGLAFSTMLTLIIIPVVFTLFVEKFKMKV